MQLEVYYLVRNLRAQGRAARQSVTVHDVLSVLPDVVDTYMERALHPLVEELPKAERDYIRAMADVIGKDRVARTMADVIGKDRVARTADIAATLGTEQKETSVARKRLLEANIVYSPSRGKLMFAIPYLSEYFEEYRIREENGLRAVEQWRM